MKDTARPATPLGPDRYQKFLPEWMRGSATPPAKPARPRRARPTRAPGGYTPGKFALDDVR